MKISSLFLLLKYFRIIYHYTGKRILLLIIIIFLTGILDSFGILLIFPLLAPTDASSPLGNLISQIFHFLQMQETITNILLLMVIVFCTKGAFTFLQNAIVGKIRADIPRETRERMVQKYFSMSYPFYTSSNIGYLNNVITTEVNTAVSGVFVYCHILVHFISLGVYLCGAALISFKLTFFLFIASFGFLFLLQPVNQSSRRASINVSEKNAQIQSLLIQLISNFKYVKATDSFSPLHQQLSINIKQHARETFWLQLLRSLVISIKEPFAIIVISLIIYWQVVITGKPIAEIFVLIGYLYRSLGEVFAFQVTSQKFNGLLGGIEAVEEARETLEKNKEVWGNKKLSGFNEAIVFKGVSFSYPNKPVFQNVHLQINKNESIGIVGYSGAGKTTLFDLLTGLLTPQQGNILIDGVNYRDLDQRSLRSLVGYVTQEPVMFNDTVANNISLWKKPQDDDLLRELDQVTMAAHCKEFLENTPEGYQAKIGDRGIKLSGGQKQRLAIARELFKNPEILIFDEATSSLDSKSEQYIQQSIQSLKGSRTLIIISHRLSTIQECDHIYVLENGQIIEQGSFQELYQQKNTLFRQMYLAQSLGN